MISAIPKEDWCYNEGDVLPTDGVSDGQCAINKDNPKEIKMFDLKSKEWKTVSE